jgi:hypothetical protein
MNNQKPAHEIRDQGLMATIWPNQEGAAAFHSVTFTRLYKAGDAWRKSHSFSLHNLDRLIQLAVQAREWMTQQEARK